MKALWENTTTTAKKRLDDLRVGWSDWRQWKDNTLLQNNAGNWNTFAEKCQTLQTQVTTAQKQIDDVKKVGSNIFLLQFSSVFKHLPFPSCTRWPKPRTTTRSELTDRPRSRIRSTKLLPPSLTPTQSSRCAENSCEGRCRQSLTLSFSGSCGRRHQVPVEPGGWGPQGSNQGDQEVKLIWAVRSNTFQFQHAFIQLEWSYQINIVSNYFHWAPSLPVMNPSVSKVQLFHSPTMHIYDRYN